MGVKLKGENYCNGLDQSEGLPVNGFSKSQTDLIPEDTGVWQSRRYDT